MSRKKPTYRAADRDRYGDKLILSLSDLEAIDRNWELVEYSRAEWFFVSEGWDGYWVLMSVFVYATKSGPYREERRVRHFELTRDEEYRVEQRNREKGYV